MREVITFAPYGKESLQEAIIENEGLPYLVKEDKLIKLWRWGDDNDLYIPDFLNHSLTLYQEHLDGPTLDMEEARKVFPEYFI